MHISRMTSEAGYDYARLENWQTQNDWRQSPVHINSDEKEDKQTQVEQEYQ